MQSLKRFMTKSSCGCNAKKSRRSNSNKRIRRSRKNRRRTLKGGYIHSGNSSSKSNKRNRSKISSI